MKYSANHKLSLVILVFMIIEYCESINTDINESIIIHNVKQYIDNTTQRYFNTFFIDEKQLDSSEFFEKVVKNISILNKEKILDNKKSPEVTFLTEFNQRQLFSFVEEFTEKIIYLHNIHKQFFDWFLNGSWNQVARRQRIQNQVMNESSKYRQVLSMIINDYILHKSHFMLGKGFFDTVRENLKKNSSVSVHETICDQTQFVQSDILKIYHLLMSFIMENYAINLIVYKKTVTKTETMKDVMKNNFKKTLESLKNDADLIRNEAIMVMKRISNDVRRCDPLQHKRYTTYDRLTNLIQGWVGSEEYLNSQRLCGFDCPFPKTKFYPHRTESFLGKLGQYEERLAYNGTLYNCTIAPSFDTITKQISPRDPERMYHHLSNQKNVSNIELWGRNINIKSNIFYLVFPTESIHHPMHEEKFMDSLKNCKICLCYIDRDYAPNSVRYFSGDMVTVPPGMVVTGIRWVIKNQTVQLELRGHKLVHGVLLPSNKEKEWYTSVFDKTNAIYLDANQRSLCLDDITMAKDMFIIGAQFKLMNGLICLSLLGVGVNETGNLIPNAGFNQYLTTAAIGNRKEMILDQPDASEWAPTDGADGNKEQSIPGTHFIKFQPTDFKKDASQTTVPYLDIQEVVTNPPTPLRGLGIYYKGVKGFGGFVALKLITVNILIKQHMVDNFDKIEYLIKL